MKYPIPTKITEYNPRIIFAEAAPKTLTNKSLKVFKNGFESNNFLNVIFTTKYKINLNIFKIKLINSMINKTDNSLYRNTSTEELRAMARKKNDAELDRICKNCCLCVGWSFVLIFFIYGFYQLLTH